MAKQPGVPALVEIGTGAFGIFAHVRFIVARLAFGGRERFAVVAGQDFPDVGQAEPTNGPLLADFLLQGMIGVAHTGGSRRLGGDAGGSKGIILGN